MEQRIISVAEELSQMDEYFIQNQIHKLLLVCGNSILQLQINDYFEQLQSRLGIEVIRFRDFAPNPDYKSVVKGVTVFREKACDAIAAVGGGSAIDVAKCIKLFANMPVGAMYLREPVIENKIPFIVMPTTAGTGSEATHFAVIYYHGVKQSVAHKSCIPEIVLFDASVLEKLPAYHKKATLADALCHAIESYWSKNATEVSRAYSAEAIRIIVQNMQEYLINNNSVNTQMLHAAYLAGKAINVAKTTAGHAMSYKMTSLYQIAHGHAVLLCIPKVWSYLAQNADTDLEKRLQELAELFNCRNSKDAIALLEEMIEQMQFTYERKIEEADIEILTESVNVERLQNTPVTLGKDILKRLYEEILKSKEGAL